MSKLDKLSRRGFLCLCLMPSIISASPLVQLQGGHGLFSKTNSNSTNKSTKKFSLFHDPEPELDPTYSWGNLVQKPAMILTTQNVALLNAIPRKLYV